MSDDRNVGGASPHHEVAEVCELLALPLDAPARLAAEAHAASCERCGLAFAEARALVTLLDELPPLPPPDPAVLARVAEVVWDSPPEPAFAHAHAHALAGESPPVPDALRFPVVAAAVTVGLVSAALGGFAKRKSADPAVFREASFALVVATVAVLTARAGRGWSFAAVLGGSVALVLAAGAESSGLGALSPAIGVKCLLLELVAAALPFAVLATLVVKRRFPPDRIVYVTIAMSGALGGHAMLDLSCPERAATLHLAVFHLGGVVLAGFFGWLFATPITARALAGPASQKGAGPP
jgi:hypothetical protein